MRTASITAPWAKASSKLRSWLQRISALRAWRFVAIASMLAIYGFALSNELYNLTSPPAFTWHVALRKTYSIVAFTLIGIFYVKMLEEFGRKATIVQTTLAVSAYSAAIEIGQALVGSHEGLLWNVIDALCGGVGGALGSILQERIR